MLDMREGKGAIFELSMSISSVISRQLSMSFWNKSSDGYLRSINHLANKILYIYTLTEIEKARMCLSLQIVPQKMHLCLVTAIQPKWHFLWDTRTFLILLIFTALIFWRRFTNGTGWQEGIAAAATPVVHFIQNIWIRLSCVNRKSFWYSSPQLKVTYQFGQNYLWIITNIFWPNLATGGAFIHHSTMGMK